jgi:hypothetical protein
MCSDADVPLSQMFLIARHLIVWSKAIAIYPICETNVYAVSPDAVLSMQLCEQFADTFPNRQLASVLSEFSPPRALVDYVSPMVCNDDDEQVHIHFLGLLYRNFCRKHEFA